MPHGSSVAGVTVDSFAPTNATRAARPALRRMAAIGCGCALAGSAVWVALDDPAAAGSRFPACGFHAVTGLWCPGCGLTRATHALLRGDVAGAISRNVFTPFVLTAIVLAWASWTLTAFGRPIVQRWRNENNAEGLNERSKTLIGTRGVITAALENLLPPCTTRWPTATTS